jgi:hypothetical protein
MSFQLKRRWDIYLNGTDGAKELTVNMLTMWRHLFPAFGLFAEALVGLIAALGRVAFVLALPLLFWIAPLVSMFTAHRTLSDDEVRERLRARIHKNGGAQ